MKRLYALAFLLTLCAPITGAGREVKLVRYPHFNHGRVAFTYLADIWTADEDGEFQRIGTLSVEQDALRLDWAEDFPKGRVAYFRMLDPRIISVLDPAPDGSGADFDCIEILAIRRPRK